MAIRIITDSASDISQVRAKEWGITVLPLKVRFGEEEFLDGVTLSPKDFYKKLVETDELPKTSQISPFDYGQAFKEAEAAGADALLLVTPYYNKATQGGLYVHFKDTADAVNIPCILYNVPSRTGCNILPETAVKLAHDVKNIVAIKEATGNISQIAKLIQLADGCIDVYSGNDDQIVPIMSLGGLGVISVLSNVAPKQTHDMCQACLEGDFKKAAKMQLEALPLIDSLFSEVNPIPVKKALNLMGFEAGPLRKPLTEMEEAHAKILEENMKVYGIY